MQLLTAVMFTIVAFKTFKVDIKKKLKLIKIKMSKEKVYYCSGWGADYPAVDSGPLLFHKKAHHPSQSLPCQWSRPDHSEGNPP